MAGATARREQVARRLENDAERLAGIFDRELTTWVSTHVWRSPMLGGIVASLVRCVAAQLRAEHPQAAQVWTCTRGVLRLASSRGTEALTAEVAALRHLLRAATHRSGEKPDLSIRAFCDEVAQVVEAGSLDELARLRASPAPRGAPRFGGIVVELFEPPTLPRGSHLGSEAISG